MDYALNVMSTTEYHRHRYSPSNRHACMCFIWKGMQKLPRPEPSATATLVRISFLSPFCADNNRLQLLMRVRREPRGSTCVSRDSAQNSPTATGRPAFKGTAPAVSGLNPVMGSVECSAGSLCAIRASTKGVHSD